MIEGTMRVSATSLNIVCTKPIKELISDFDAFDLKTVEYSIVRRTFGNYWEATRSARTMASRNCTGQEQEPLIEPDIRNKKAGVPVHYPEFSFRAN